MTRQSFIRYRSSARLLERFQVVIIIWLHQTAIVDSQCGVIRLTKVQTGAMRLAERDRTTLCE